MTWKVQETGSKFKCSIHEGGYRPTPSPIPLHPTPRFCTIESLVYVYFHRITFDNLGNVIISFVVTAMVIFIASSFSVIWPQYITSLSVHDVLYCIILLNSSYILLFFSNYLCFLYTKIINTFVKLVLKMSLATSWNSIYEKITHWQMLSPGNVTPPLLSSSVYFSYSWL